MVTLVNRAKVATASVGTGTITLGAAESGYQSFADAGVVDTDVVRYVIEDGADWEIGTGTYTASGTTLSRTVLESSNADAALNLTGSAVVYVSAAAEDIPPALESYAENSSSPTAPSATGPNALAIGYGAAATGPNSLSIGGGSEASQSTCQALGYNAGASKRDSSAIGTDSRAAGIGSVVMGKSHASGTNSFAAAIANNLSSYGATGANSVAIGDGAKASASDSFCLSNASTASGSGAAVFGGQSNTASASSSLVLGGGSNTANSQRSVAYGYYGNTDGILGKVAHGIGPSRQNGMYGLAIDTADATPKQLVTDYFFAGSATNQVILPNNSAYVFHGTIVARQQASAGTACAAWKIEGLIRREGSAGTTVLVNSATTVLDNTPAWGMALSADTTNGGLKIEVTGAAATNIRWVATIHTSEVTY